MAEAESKASPEQTQALWVPVFCFEQFLEVSDLGFVRARDNKEVLAFCKGPGNYLNVSPKIGEARIFLPVHRTVCRAFHGDPGPLPKSVPHWVARHLDANRYNNKASNLMWGTPPPTSRRRRFCAWAFS